MTTSRPLLAPDSGELRRAPPGLLRTVLYVREPDAPRSLDEA